MSANTIEPDEIEPDRGVVPSVDEHGAEAAPAGLFHRVVFLVGAGGLLLATATDALGVLGRHTAVPLLGAIEVVQCAIILIASAAMVAATLERAHASVHIFTERMRPATVRLLDRGTSLLGALLFAIMVAGSVWVAADLWHGHERTEILHIPLRALRLVWIGAALIVCGLFLSRAFRRNPR